ncbi:MAG: hypothetical protein U1D30_00200 [Planctomycetota bacterium]
MERRTFLSAVGGLTVGTMTGRQATADAPKDHGLKLRYAINIGTHFTKHPVLDRLKLVADAGFTAIEFNGLPFLDRAPGATEPNYKAIETYGNALRDLELMQGVWVTNPCAGECDSNITDPAKHAQFLEYVKATAHLPTGRRDRIHRHEWRGNTRIVTQTDDGQRGRGTETGRRYRQRERTNARPRTAQYPGRPPWLPRRPERARL